MPRQRDNPPSELASLEAGPWRHVAPDAHLPPIPPWQARLYRLTGIVLVVGVSAVFWTLIILGAMAVLYSAMRAVGP